MIFIDAAAVADRLDLRDAPAFLRIRERLERDAGFPPPVPILRKPLKWRADAVDAWIEAQGMTAPAVTPTPGGNVVLLREAGR